MPIPPIASGFSRLAKLGFGIALFLLISNTFGTEPRFHYIRKYGTNQVIIHFYTDANRTYVLQYVDTLSCHTNSMLCNSNGVPMKNWSNLFTNVVVPFPYDFTVVDATTNKSRFYRLSVTP